MELQKAEKLAKKLMAEHLTMAWKFKFDNAIRRFGCCSWRKWEISLSRHLVKLNSEIEVKNIILHEIAHALVDIDIHHGFLWKQKAIEIGCSGDRCYDSENVFAPPRKYTGTCPRCKFKVQRDRIRRTSCGKCCNIFNPKYLLTWIKNI